MSESTITEIPYGRKNPFPATVLEVQTLNGRGSIKQTCHVELSLEGSGMEYVAGDVAGVLGVNCPEVVEDFLAATGLDGDATVEDGTSLRESLTTGWDITTMNPAFLKKYAPLAINADLDALLEEGDKQKISDWLWGREKRDAFLEFKPASPLSQEQVLGLLRKMAPRLYSIASSLKAHPDEVHLTVGAVEFETSGLTRKGVCSTYLCQRIEKGDKVRVFMHHNKNFNLPEDGDIPIIMVGPGTGIAPFRAFIEERMALGHKGRNWLFFGDQHLNTDFLYQLEWQKFMKSGALEKMHCAWSRDQDYKIYVQDKIRENAAEIWEWLQAGAHFYVCGDANRMAKDVHQALIDIHVEQGGLSAEDAEAAVKELQKAKRYQRDVY